MRCPISCPLQAASAPSEPRRWVRGCRRASTSTAACWPWATSSTRCQRARRTCRTATPSSRACYRSGGVQWAAAKRGEAWCGRTEPEGPPQCRQQWFWVPWSETIWRAVKGGACKSCSIALPLPLCQDRTLQYTNLCLPCAASGLSGWQLAHRHDCLRVSCRCQPGGEPEHAALCERRGWLSHWEIYNFALCLGLPVVLTAWVCVSLCAFLIVYHQFFLSCRQTVRATSATSRW